MDKDNLPQEEDSSLELLGPANNSLELEPVQPEPANNSLELEPVELAQFNHSLELELEPVVPKPE